MTDLDEAFDVFTRNETSSHIEYFFTQRTVNEEHDYIDKNMNRSIKSQKVSYNFLALTIPTLYSSITDNKYMSEVHIKIYGDEGYYYKGILKSFNGNIPSFMIPIKTDKRIFVTVTFKYTDSNEPPKMLTNFIDVPKRYQSISSGSEIKNDN